MLRRSNSSRLSLEQLLGDGDAQAPPPPPPDDDGDSTPTCQACQAPVTASTPSLRVGEILLHTEHFTCRTCAVPLHDQPYRKRDKAFYCEKDFRAQFCPLCKACGGVIFEGSVVQACEAQFHATCFKCTTCATPFPDGKFYHWKGQPYCQQHYLAAQGVTCTRCKLPLGNARQEWVRVRDQVYHSDCVRCAQCRTLITGGVFQHEDKLLCMDDFALLYAHVCATCGKAIVKQRTVVNDESYHRACLKCDICDAQLDEYRLNHGSLRCSEHLATLLPDPQCGLCLLSIERPAPAVRAAGLISHQLCLRCRTCRTLLSKPEARPCADGRVSCVACLERIGDPEPTEPPARSERHHQSVTERPSTPKAKPIRRPPPANTHARSSSTLPSSIAASLERAKQRKQQQHHHVAGIIEEEDEAPPPPPPMSPSSDEDDGKGDDLLNVTWNFGSKLNLAEHVGNKVEWQKGSLIGQGASGKVFMGMNTATGELLAIKQVPVSEDGASALQMEVEMMKRLRHPNIVALLDTEYAGNKLSMVMEYVSGNSLDTLLNKFGPLKESLVRNYTHQLVDALVFCHASKVVHRDVKGKNILVNREGQVKLADFGSAKRLANVLSSDAPSIDYTYTPLWTAPEVLKGNYNAKIDVWSLGCVVIEMYSAQQPWAEEKFDNPFRALYHIGNSDKTPAVPEHVSALGKAFLARCLTRDPELRPEAKDLLDDPWFAETGT